MSHGIRSAKLVHIVYSVVCFLAFVFSINAHADYPAYYRVTISQFTSSPAYGGVTLTKIFPAQGATGKDINALWSGAGLTPGACQATSEPARAYKTAQPSTGYTGDLEYWWGGCSSYVGSGSPRIQFSTERFCPTGSLTQGTNCTGTAPLDCPQAAKQFTMSLGFLGLVVGQNGGPPAWTQKISGGTTSVAKGGCGYTAVPGGVKCEVRGNNTGGQVYCSGTYASTGIAAPQSSPEAVSFDTVQQQPLYKPSNNTAVSKSADGNTTTTTVTSDPVVKITDSGGTLSIVEAWNPSTKSVSESVSTTSDSTKTTTTTTTTTTNNQGSGVVYNVTNTNISQAGSYPGKSTSSTSTGTKVTYTDGSSSQSTNCTGDCPNPDPTSNVNGGLACDAPPACSGDAIQCAILRQTWEDRCQSAKWITDLKGTDAYNAGDSILDPNNPKNKIPKAGTINITDSIHFDDSGLVQGAAVCPAPYTLNLGSMLGSYTISYQPFCDLAGMLRPLLLAFAYFMGGLVILKNMFR